MKNKKISILNEGELDYIAKIVDNEIKLKRSKGEQWLPNCRGENIGSLTDDGNKIIIKVDDLELKLDYSDFMYMYLLCDLKVKEDSKLVGKIEYLKKSR